MISTPSCASLARRTILAAGQPFTTFTTRRNVMGNLREIAKRSTVLCCVLFTVFAAAVVTRSQTRYPGPDARENNRSMDEYDRALNRMKNDARAASERRRSLFPQINEDFQRLQVIHNEIVRMLQPD